MKHHLKIIAALAFSLALGTSPGLAQRNPHNIDCQNAISTPEMRYCAGLEYEKADAKLNAFYQRIFPGLNRREKKFLRKAQRAWIAYKDSACDSYSLIADGGTAQPMFGTTCRTRLTEERLKMLQDQFQER